MITIHEKVKKQGIKFVLLEKSGKKPFQKEWQNKTIGYDNPELVEHLKKGGNYGILGGGEKNLIIIDFDNEKVQEEVIKKLPKTFTVKTGSGMLHKYFYSNRSESFKIFDDDMNTLVDVQGEGKQVVAPCSIHPNGNCYEVVDDSDINYLEYSEIKAILEPYNKKKKKDDKVFERPRVDIEDNFIDKLKSTISFQEVLSSFGIDISKNPTECYFHHSKGGKCLGFNNNTGHCFHCDNSWNIFSFVKEAKNCSFKEALDYLSNLAGLQDELEVSRQKYIEKIKEAENFADKHIKNEFLSFIRDKKFGEASEIIVDYIKRKNYIYTTKEDNKSEIWVYKEGIFVPQGKSEVKEIMRRLLGNWYNAFYYNQVINKLEPDTFIDSKEFFNNIQVNEVPVKNGILNVLTKEIKEYSPDKIFFNKLPVEYNPQSDCPEIEKFLKQVLANEEDIKVFYELAGYCLLKEYKFEKAFMFVGDGRNGKDKSLELIKRMIGVENCCSVPLSSIIPESFIISEFFGKMVNIAGDINNHDLKDTSTFKGLTGRSLFSAPRKFLNPITFVNYAKFVFACNELPRVYDTSKGFWDRWVLLEFPYTFVTQEELDNCNNPNFKLRDENIIEKITTEQELSGFLNKSLQGLHRLLNKKDFSTTKGSKEIKDLWIRKADSFMAFALDHLEGDYNESLTKRELRKYFSDYCKEHHVKGASDKNIKVVLEELFGVTERQTWNEGIRFWDGIKFKPSSKYNYTKGELLNP